MTPKSLLAPARLAGLPLLRSQSDDRLVDLVRAGNDAAFEAIVARYRRPLLRHCTGILGEERAEDVVQAAFVRALRAMRADERPLDLKPWLYTIAHNGALNALRDRSVPSDTLEEEIDGVERPEQAFERREGLREVVAAVGSLPERQRNALVLRELEGRSYSEIALALGVSDGAVRQLLNRARKSLRAGVTAVTPTALLLRVPFGSEGALADRVAEVTAAGASVGSVAAKACATALVAGAVVGGAAAVPDGRSDPLRPPMVRGAVADAGLKAADAAEGRDGKAADPPEAGGDHSRGGGRGSQGGPSRGERESESGDERGSGDREHDSSRDDHSGPGGDDSSGSGSGGSERSGFSDDGGSSGSGSGSSGLGSGGSGPGDGSGSGSGSSGSGSSGSGSGSSGSGSGSSGSGSSGSGSGSGRSGSTSGSTGLDDD